MFQPKCSLVVDIVFCPSPNEQGFGLRDHVIALPHSNILVGVIGGAAPRTDEETTVTELVEQPGLRRLPYRVM